MTTTLQDTNYEDALEDVHTRFILNLPESELQTPDRIFFQLEQAWWFYEDWICDQHPEWNLPRFATLKPFALELFGYSPLLPDPSHFTTMWTEFTQYKRKISNYGCILLSADCRKFVLCRVWMGKAYTFPSGKINQGENGMTAAARETYEETGFDPACKFGLTATWKQTEPHKVTWPEMQEKDALVCTDEGSGKRRTAYVVVGVPEDFDFEPVARKEISQVQWYPLDDFPKQSYAVIPFLGPLRRWIKKYRQNIRSSSVKSRDRSNRKQRQQTPHRTGSRGRVIRANDDLVAAGLAAAGDVSGWSEEEMFQANERLMGRRVEYDGNPHVFAEKGFGGRDPHAFRVVGGNFLNSDLQQSKLLAPPPDRSKLQPLFRNSEKETQQQDDEDLTPFFTDQGMTPWGEVVEEACDATPSRDDKALFKKNKKKKKAKEEESSFLPSPTESSQQVTSLFLTDREITAKSQATKQTTKTKREELERQYQQDMEYIRQWVAKLPKPQPTKHFGEFKLDFEKVMAAAAPALERPRHRNDAA